MEEEEGLKAMTAPAWRMRRAGMTHQRPVVLAPPKDAERATRFFEQVYTGAQEAWPDLWTNLTDVGRQRFVQELIGASFTREPDQRQTELQKVIEAWYGTMALRHSPIYSEGAAQAGQGELYTPDELKARLSL